MFSNVEIDAVAFVGEEAEAARKFYCDVLGGRQIRAVPAAAAAGELWFLVDRALVKTGPHVRGSTARVALWVEDVEEIATRCWDAGFTVRVHPAPLGSAGLTIVDPFELEIALVARRNAA